MPSTAYAVSLKKLADDLRSSRPYIRRVAEDAAIPVITFRASNGKQAEGVSPNDVSTLIEMFHASREENGQYLGESLGIQTVVYVVRLDPVYRPGRIKVGVSDGLAGRLQAFRVTCPEAIEVTSMPVPRACEGYALALAEAMSTRVGVEVFDFEEDSLASYVSLLEQAFAPLMHK
jgi:hypothetical protein